MIIPAIIMHAIIMATISYIEMPDETRIDVGPSAPPMMLISINTHPFLYLIKFSLLSWQYLDMQLQSAAQQLYKLLYTLELL